MCESTPNYASIIESLLFVWGEPLSIAKISKLINLSQSKTEQVIQALQRTYEEEQRGIQIIEVNRHYQFCTLKNNYPYIESLCTTSKNRGLSNSALEVLAIIAYRQPITKVDIEQIRGVNSDGPLLSLMDRELVEVVGKLDRIGRPQIYGTTDMFLKSFGYQSLEDLPQNETFETLASHLTQSSDEITSDEPVINTDIVSEE